MKREETEQIIAKIDALIATLQQAVVIGGRTRKERQATELLLEARMKLIEQYLSRAALLQDALHVTINKDNTGDHEGEQQNSIGNA